MENPTRKHNKESDKKSWKKNDWLQRVKGCTKTFIFNLTTGFKKYCLKTTRSIAYDKKNRKDYCIATSIDIFIQLAYLLPISIVCLGFESSATFHTSQGVVNQFIREDFPAADQIAKNFQAISSLSDIWQYTRELFTAQLYDKITIPMTNNSLSSNQSINLKANTLLGRVRVRQLRVRNNSCEVWEPFQQLRTDCYAEYSSKTRDTQSYGPEDMKAWFYSPQSETGHLEFEIYEGGGYYMDLPIDRAEFEIILHDLNHNLWIDFKTRAVLIHFTLYNTNLNIFTLVWIFWEITADGSVRPKYNIRSSRISDYSPVEFVAEIVALTIATYYFIVVIREVIYFRRKILFKFWKYIDVMLFVLIILVIIKGLVRKAMSDRLANKLQNNPDKYVNTEAEVAVEEDYNHIFAVIIFFVYMRTLQYLDVSKTMVQIYNAIKKCLKDIAGFIVIFIFVFYAFAECGYTIFGQRIHGFSTLGRSVFTLLRTIFGDFDFHSTSTIHPIIAPLFFIFYIIFVFFILLNIFLSIISDAYSDVKTELSTDEIQEPELFDYMKNYLNAVLGKMFKRFSSPKKDDESKKELNKIKQALNDCGFTPLEIGMFFARYNIDPTAEVREYDRDEILNEIEKREQEELFNQGLPGDQRNNVKIYADDFQKENKKIDEIEEVLQQLHTTTDNLISTIDTAIGNKNK